MPKRLVQHSLALYHRAAELLHQFYDVRPAGQGLGQGRAWVTTTSWVWVVALRIRSAKGVRRSGCRLVSGSFRTIRAGGRGVSSAATQSR